MSGKTPFGSFGARSLQIEIDRNREPREYLSRSEPDRYDAHVFSLFRIKSISFTHYSSNEIEITLFTLLCGRRRRANNAKAIEIRFEIVFRRPTLYHYPPARNAVLPVTDILLGLVVGK